MQQQIMGGSGFKTLASVDIDHYHKTGEIVLRDDGWRRFVPEKEMFKYVFTIMAPKRIDDVVK